MKNYINDCINLYKRNKKFLVKATIIIMVVYAAMAAIAVYWDQISAWFQKFLSGKTCVKWNPGRLGRFVSYDDDDTTGGLDADEADE